MALVSCRHCRQHGGRYHRHRPTLFSQPLFYFVVLVIFVALATIDYIR